MLFDVDGTLVRGASTERAFFIYLLRRALIGPRQLLAWVAFCALYAAHFGRGVLKANKAWLAGLPCNAIAALAARFVREEIPARLDPRACARLRAHLREGDRVWLLTGTPDFIAAPLAAMLGAHGYRAAVCARRAGRFTAAPPLQHPYAARKLSIARELCALERIDLDRTVAYADSATDIALLSAVGHPVAVNARRRVRAQARRKGWEILEPAP